ncbi:MAG TPA: LPD5 domain-containing protein, partial [Ramlibacter sp.]
SDEVKDEEWLSEPFGKLWPADEHEQYDNPFISALVYAAREMVPAKPRTSWKAKAWVEKVKGLRDLGATATRMELTRERLLERMGRLRGLDQFANKVRILEALPRDQWKRIGKVGFYPEAYGYEDGKQVAKPYGYVEVDGKLWQYEGEDFDGLIRRAQSNVDTLVPAEAPKMKFEVRGPTKGKYIIVKTGDREYRPLMETTELAEARKAIKDAHAVLVASWERVKDRDNVKERDLRSEVNRPRTGKDWRQGKDVTPEQFQEAFGFRGGEFGTWVTQGAGGKERQGLLNQAYDALQDLAYLLGIQPKAISLNGTLGIAFGSRGSGWASAHFEPSNLVINLTKTRGAGALGHEWFHALDNYFARRRNDGQEVPIKAGLGDVQGDYRRANYITYKPEAMLVHKTQPRLKMTRERLRQLHEAQPGLDTYKPENWMPDPAHPQGVRAEVEERWNEVVQALNASPMAKRAAAIDKGPDGYWSRIIERAARSFENYILAKMQAQGFSNDYLSNVVGLSQFPRDPDRYPYLLLDEVGPIAQAFDNLF